MSKETKKWLITAASLVVVGSIIFTGVMTVLNWNFKKLSTVKYETNSYELDDFNNIKIITNTAKIVFKPSSDGKNKVVCFEEEAEKHTVEAKEDTLSITIQNTKKWYQYIGINFNSPLITVYLAKSEYKDLVVEGSTADLEIPNAFTFENTTVCLSTGDVTINSKKLGEIKIKTGTGDITVENALVKSLDLTVSTGKITVNNLESETDVNLKVSTGKTRLSNLSCKNLWSTGSTGDIFLENVVADEKLSIIRDTGDVRLNKCDGAEIYIKTDTGDVKGSLITEKVFIANTDTGRVDVPKTTQGGKCEITTDTGNIKIEITS